MNEAAQVPDDGGSAMGLVGIRRRDSESMLQASNDGGDDGCSSSSSSSSTDGDGEICRVDQLGVGREDVAVDSFDDIFDDERMPRGLATTTGATRNGDSVTWEARQSQHPPPRASSMTSSSPSNAPGAGVSSPPSKLRPGVTVEAQLQSAQDPKGCGRGSIFRNLIARGSKAKDDGDHSGEEADRDDDGLASVDSAVVSNDEVSSDTSSYHSPAHEFEAENESDDSSAEDHETLSLVRNDSLASAQSASVAVDRDGTDTEDGGNSSCASKTTIENEEQVTIAGSRYDFDENWNMIGRQIPRQCGFITSGVVESEEDGLYQNLSTRGNCVRDLLESPSILPSETNVSLPSQNVEEHESAPPKTSASAAVSDEEELFSTSHLQLLPRRRTLSTPTPCRSLRRRRAGGDLGSAYESSDDDRLDVSEDDDDVGDTSQIPPALGLGDARNVDESACSFDDFAGTPVGASSSPTAPTAAAADTVSVMDESVNTTSAVSTTDASVTATSSSSNSSQTHRRRRRMSRSGSSAPSSFGAFDVSNPSMTSTTVSSSTRGHRNRLVTSRGPATATGSSEHPSGELVTTGNALRASLDSGMTAIRRWLRSRPFSTATSGSGPRPSRAAMNLQRQNESTSSMQLGEEDLFALSNAGLDPRRTQSAQSLPSRGNYHYDVGGNSNVVVPNFEPFLTTRTTPQRPAMYPPPIAEEEVVESTRPRAFSEPDRMRIRDFFMPVYRTPRRQQRAESEQSSATPEQNQPRRGSRRARFRGRRARNNEGVVNEEAPDSARSHVSSSASAGAVVSRQNSFLASVAVSSSPPHRQTPNVSTRSSDGDGDMDLLEAGFHSTATGDNTENSGTDRLPPSGVTSTEGNGAEALENNAPVGDSNHGSGASTNASGVAESGGNSVAQNNDPNRAARSRWMQVNRRFQLIITIVALVFSLLLFAILVCWVVFTSAYVVSIDKDCDVPLKTYFWLATLQLILDVFRTDIMRFVFRWDANSRQRVPPRVILYNIAYLTYAILVLRMGVRSVFLNKGGTCSETAPELFRTSTVFVSLSIAAWSVIVLGYLVPFCFVAIILTRNGYNPTGDANVVGGRLNVVGGVGVFPAVYTNLGAPPECINRLRVVLLEEFPQEYPRDCCICMMDFVAGEVIVATECEHVFHKRCCQEWLQQARTCPVCRTDIPSSLGISDPGPGDEESTDNERRRVDNETDRNSRNFVREEFHQEVVNLLRILRQHEERLRARNATQQSENEDDVNNDTNIDVIDQSPIGSPDMIPISEQELSRSS